VRLDFESWDGRVKARVFHGDDCVALTIEEQTFRAGGMVTAGIVLRPKEAAALGRRLIQQAKVAKEAHEEGS
jgi:hypothetical protein